MTEPHTTRRQDHSGKWNVGHLLLQSGKDLLTDNGPQWAAALAYYALLSLFPLLLATASVAAFFVSREDAVSQVMRLIGSFMPQSRATVDEVVHSVAEARGPASLLSLVTLVWTGSRVFGTLTQALNIAFDVDETYGLGKRLLIEVGMVLSFGVLLLLALSSGLLLDLVRRVTGVQGTEHGLLSRLADALVPTALLSVTFFLIYRFVPRKRPDWKSAAGGAVAATLLFLLARPLFTYYVRQFAGYNLIYGSLSIIIVLLVWSWLTSLIVLFGGEVAAHVQMLWLERQSSEEVSRRHEA